MKEMKFWTFVRGIFWGKTKGDKILSLVTMGLTLFALVTWSYLLGFWDGEIRVEALRNRIEEKKALEEFEERLDWTKEFKSDIHWKKHEYWDKITEEVTNQLTGQITTSTIPRKIILYEPDQR